jgi:hypothetical protein
MDEKSKFSLDKDIEDLIRDPRPIREILKGRKREAVVESKECQSVYTDIPVTNSSGKLKIQRVDTPRPFQREKTSYWKRLEKLEKFKPYTEDWDFLINPSEIMKSWNQRSTEWRNTYAVAQRAYSKRNPIGELKAPRRKKPDALEDYAPYATSTEWDTLNDDSEKGKMWSERSQKWWITYKRLKGLKRNRTVSQ